MEPVLITSLWLPILLSAVLVFIASALAWMVLPHHRSDFAKLPDEEAARAALKGTPPGEYVVPYAVTAEDWKTEEWMAKAQEGPSGIVTLRQPGPPNMGKQLATWFVYSLVVSVFVAYLTGRALPAGTAYLEVFRFAGTIAFVAYGCAHFADSIWMGRGWMRTLKDAADGLVYALLTAGAFGWLWP